MANAELGRMTDRDVQLTADVVSFVQDTDGDTGAEVSAAAFFSGRYLSRVVAAYESATEEAPFTYESARTLAGESDREFALTMRACKALAVHAPMLFEDWCRASGHYRDELTEPLIEVLARVPFRREFEAPEDKHLAVRLIGEWLTADAVAAGQRDMKDARDTARQFLANVGIPSNPGFSNTNILNLIANHFGVSVALGEDIESPAGFSRAIAGILSSEHTIPLSTYRDIVSIADAAPSVDEQG